MSLTDRTPHDRGYAFEKFLKKVFDLFGLEAESPLRLVGEQIDGSFVLDGQTYLVESKVAQRAYWCSRPAFVPWKSSTSVLIGAADYLSATPALQMWGWSRSAAHAKLFAWMVEISESFQRKIPLPDVIRRRARKAVEHGVVLARVSDLFN